MTTQTLHICRRSNGAIDIDHYRNLALMERRAVMTSVMRTAISWPLVAARAFVAAVTGLRELNNFPKEPGVSGEMCRSKKGAKSSGTACNAV